MTDDQKVKLSNFVELLCKETEIDRFANDPNAEEWIIANLNTTKFKLSGGQMQLAAAIQAIVNKPMDEPYIITADEIFAGLDNKSIIKLQQIFLNKLANATFIIVDHEAKNHNYNNFYDYLIHFENGIVTMNKPAITLVEDKAINLEQQNDFLALGECSAFNYINPTFA